MRSVCAVALLGVVGLIAGCGGSPSDPTRSTAASGQLSKAEWLAQAEAICKSEARDLAPLNRKLGRLNDSGLTTPVEMAEFAAILRTRALPRYEEALREWRALEPPGGSFDAIDALLGKAEEADELLEQTAEELREGHAEKAMLLSFKVAMANRTAEWMTERDGLEIECPGY